MRNLLCVCLVLCMLECVSHAAKKKEDGCPKHSDLQKTVNDVENQVQEKKATVEALDGEIKTLNMKLHLASEVDANTKQEVKDMKKQLQACEEASEKAKHDMSNFDKRGHERETKMQELLQKRREVEAKFKACKVEINAWTEKQVGEKEEEGFSLAARFVDKLKALGKGLDKQDYLDKLNAKLGQCLISLEEDTQPDEDDEKLVTERKKCEKYSAVLRKQFDSCVSDWYADREVNKTLQKKKEDIQKQVELCKTIIKEDEILCDCPKTFEDCKAIDTKVRDVYGGKYHTKLIDCNLSRHDYVMMKFFKKSQVQEVMKDVEQFEEELEELKEIKQRCESSTISLKDKLEAERAELTELKETYEIWDAKCQEIIVDYQQCGKDTVELNAKKEETNPELQKFEEKEALCKADVERMQENRKAAIKDMRKYRSYTLACGVVLLLTWTALMFLALKDHVTSLLTGWRVSAAEGKLKRGAGMDKKLKAS